MRHLVLVWALLFTSFCWGQKIISVEDSIRSDSLILSKIRFDDILIKFTYPDNYQLKRHDKKIFIHGNGIAIVVSMDNSKSIDYDNDFFEEYTESENCKKFNNKCIYTYGLNKRLFLERTLEKKDTKFVYLFTGRFLLSGESVLFDTYTEIPKGEDIKKIIDTLDGFIESLYTNAVSIDEHYYYFNS